MDDHELLQNVSQGLTLNISGTSPIRDLVLQRVDDTESSLYYCALVIPFLCESHYFQNTRANQVLSIGNLLLAESFAIK